MEEEPIQIQPFVTLQNGSRVTPRQLEFITEIKGSRFVGVKKPGRGILILKDTQPQMEEENSGVIKDQGIEMTEEHKALADALLSNNNDPKPPEPFEWNF
ncbi:26S proteasome non-ATPase regulatory subunit [Entamoeba histolytica HM-3:IMSS]|nr:26S proteasome non-ATPase regulatory subunit [Entamoeba histolytica HM-3:IMSS]